MPLLWTTLRLVLLEAAKSKLSWLIAAIALISVGISQFLGQLAILEAAEIQSTIQAAFLRISGVFIVVTFVITSMVRETDDKVTDLLLSQPPPRSAYYFGKLFGYGVVALAVATIFAIPASMSAHLPGLAAWFLSLACELVLMSALAIFCALSFSQVLPALSATAAFYVLSRSMNTIQLIATAPSLAPPSIADQIIAWIVKIVALFLPRLDQFAQSTWVMSDVVPQSLSSSFLQSVPCLGIIVAASLFDLYRKNF